MKSFFIGLLTVVLSCFSSIANAQIIDSSFAQNGLIPYGTTGNSQQNLGVGNKMIVQPDGKLVVAIDKFDPNGPTDLYFYTYRYNADGSTDTTYGVGGASKIFTGTSSKNKDLKIEADGKIIVVGESEYCINGICGAPQFVMMRLLPNGFLDSSFGNGGVVLSNHIFGNTGTYASPVRVELASNNKFIIAGKGPGYTQFIARLHHDGTVDFSFANNGIYLDSTVQASIVDIKTDNQENIYALFLKYSSPLDTMNYADNYVLKLLPTGQFDPSFGNMGKTIVNLGNEERPSSMALRQDGKLVVVGTVRTFHYAFGMMDKGEVFILNEDGTLSNLLNNGSAYFTFPGDSTAFFQTIKIAPNNEMLIGGNVTTKINGNYHQKSLLALLKEDGNLNYNFNSTGYLIMDHGLHANIGSLACILDVHMIPNQKIVFTGYRNPIAGNVKRSVYLTQLKNTGIDNTNSINSITQNENLKIFPNPSTRLFYLSQIADKILVYSLDGKMIHSDKNTTTIDLNNFLSGTYTLQATVKGKNYVIKFVKE